MLLQNVVADKVQLFSRINHLSEHRYPKRTDFMPFFVTKS